MIKRLSLSSVGEKTHAIPVRGDGVGCRCGSQKAREGGTDASGERGHLGAPRVHHFGALCFGQVTGWIRLELALGDAFQLDLPQIGRFVTPAGNSWLRHV